MQPLLPSIVFVDHRSEVIAALKLAFADLPSELVTVVQQDMRNLMESDAVVSPANCFGIMDGGIDKVYRDMFGSSLEDRVQDAIKTAGSFNGSGRAFLPIGEALIVRTEDKRSPYFIVAPTVVMPGHEATADHVERAFFAIVQLVLANKKIRRVVCPGLGCGVGRLNPAIMAQHLRRAFDVAWKNPAESSDQWHYSPGSMARAQDLQA